MMEQDIDNNMMWSVKQNEKALNISFFEKACFCRKCRSQGTKTQSSFRLLGRWHENNPGRQRVKCGALWSQLRGGNEVADCSDTKGWVQTNLLINSLAAGLRRMGKEEGTFLLLLPTDAIYVQCLCWMQGRLRYSGHCWYRLFYLVAEKGRGPGWVRLGFL